MIPDGVGEEYKKIMYSSDKDVCQCHIIMSFVTALSILLTTTHQRINSNKLNLMNLSNVQVASTSDIE